jgi:ribosomal protein S18 acetylase RimI-like enzyme
MTLCDWRRLDPAVVRTCYDRERRHWQQALGWDTAWTWATVEEARAGRDLPGFVAFDTAGVARGWTFYVIDHRYRHIGGLVADSSAATAALLDGVLQEPAEVDACFILNRAEGLEAALADRDFDVERFQYLSCPLPRPSRPDAAASSRARTGFRADPWRDTDRVGVAALLSAAYTPAAGVHFAPDGDWNTYVSGLVEQAGCGVFDAVLTSVVRAGGGIAAAVIATSLSSSTAHVAQVAVHPDRRGQGLASALVEHAMDAAAAQGKTALTLIVGERNAAARDVYASLGFSSCATFVAARREGPGLCQRSLSA